jgi:hypothetical protein
MNTSLLKKSLLAALLAGTFLTARAELKVGDTLPDLASFKLEGKLPDSLKGKIVVVSGAGRDAKKIRRQARGHRRERGRKSLEHGQVFEEARREFHARAR